MNTLQHLLAALALGTGLAASAGAAAAQPADETEWAVQLPRATWPGDIVRWADQVPRNDPSSPEVQDERRRAAEVLSMLRGRDVQLFRSAFQAEPGAAERNADMRRAALGDGGAAYRLARSYQGSAAPADEHRYVGWLQLAAKLGHERAAYDLAVHFRREGQLIQASAYEARAVALGYTPPQALDHIRK